MSLPDNQPRLTGKYIFITMIAVAASWILHELAHWTMGTLLGYEMGMTFNKAFPISGKFNNDQHYQLVSAAGPFFTFVEALIIFLIMQRKRIVGLYPFLFTCFYMRLFATGISILNPNDEARISHSIGLGKFTLPIIMVAILFLFFYTITGKYKFNRKFILATLGLIILFSSIIILTDQYLHPRLL